MSVNKRELPLSSALREKTKKIHTTAEKSGFISDLIKGTISVPAYVLFLRNLHYVYQVMEEHLSVHEAHPILISLNYAALFRSDHISFDLVNLVPVQQLNSLTILPSAHAYANRITTMSIESPELLLAHFYVRYLGDLNGGQILAKKLSTTLKLTEKQLSFYRFDGVPDIKHKLIELRHAIDSAGEQLNTTKPMLAEAMLAFELNIALSKEVNASCTS